MSSCVVTGAALGMGRAISERVLADGMDVVGVDWNAEALERAAVELGERFVPLRADVGDWETHVRAADLAETRGPLAGWVNNAGIDIQGGAHEVTPGGDRAWASGPPARGHVRHGDRRPAHASGRAGSIVNIASIQGTHAFPRYFVYQAAKAAAIMVSKGVAVDYGPFGIRCNAVSPGDRDADDPTRCCRRSSRARRHSRREDELHPIGRIGPARGVAEVGGLPALGPRVPRHRDGAPVDGGATARCFGYPLPEMEAALS